MPNAATLARKQKQAIDRAIAGVEDDAVTRWAQAWEDVAADLQTAIADTLADTSLTKAQQRRRLARTLQTVADALIDAAQQTGADISAQARRLIRQALADQEALITEQLPIGAGVTLDRPNRWQIAAIVRRAGQQIHSLEWALSADAEQAMKRELIRGVAIGAHPDRVAAAMVRRVEKRFNGGLARAVTIARTEMMDAYRHAAQQSRIANTDVLQGWRWECTLSERTCPACLGMAGTMHDVDEPGPMGHQNCRCTAVPVTRTWTDLGYRQVDEPDTGFPDPDSWFRGLPAAAQRSILGDDGYTAWRAGEFPRESWARRRHTSGWRNDSQAF